LKGVNCYEEPVVTSDWNSKGIKRALKVNGMEQLNTLSSDQFIQAAKQYAEEIIRGSATPYEGSKLIWIECQLRLEKDDHRLDPFAYWAGEIEATLDDDRLVQCELAIRVAAESLINDVSAI